MTTLTTRARPLATAFAALAAALLAFGVLVATPPALAAAADVEPSNVAILGSAEASYTAAWNSLAALNDQKPPVNQGGSHGDVWGTYGNNPASQWAQYNWEHPVTVDRVVLWFWHDAPPGTGGNVAVPESWNLQYWDATTEAFRDVPNPSGYGTAQTGSNETTFDAVTTTRLRATFQASPGTVDPTRHAGVAVTEWQVWGTGGTAPEEPERPEGLLEVREVHVPTQLGVAPALPATVTLVFVDGGTRAASVTWAEPTAAQLSTVGKFSVKGTVADPALEVAATVWVRDGAAGPIVAVEPVAVVTLAGVAPQLPGTVIADFEDGRRDSSVAVDWDAIDPAEYAAADAFFVVEGDVVDTDLSAEAYVFVELPAEGTDTIAPTLTLTEDPVPATSGWHLGATAVTIVATDNADDAPVVEYRIGDGEWAPYTAALPIEADGVQTITARATDAASNVAERSLEVKVDATAPDTVATLELIGDSVEVTLAASDAGSGVDRIQWEGPGTFWGTYQAPFTRALTNEPQIIQFAATDVAGNEEERASIELPALAEVDTEAPVVTIEPDRAANDAGWYDGAVTISVTATDAPAADAAAGADVAASAVTSVEVSIDGGEWAPYSEPVTIDAEGATTIEARATDAAGNTSQPVKLDVSIDSVKPTVSAAAVGSLLILTGVDDGSGVERIEYSVKKNKKPATGWREYAGPFPIDAMSVVSVRVIDAAGNVGDVVTFSRKDLG